MSVRNNTLSGDSFRDIATVFYQLTPYIVQKTGKKKLVHIKVCLMGCVCQCTHSERHDKVDHALLVVALPAAEGEPLVHHAAIPQALRDGDMGPCYPVVHGERSLDAASVITHLNRLETALFIKSLHKHFQRAAAVIGCI